MNQAIDVREEDGRIVIEPAREASFDLVALVEGITDANRHEAVETGPATGHEIW